MPAAICALKPCPGDVHKHVANPPMAGLPSKDDEKSWPKAVDTKELPGKPRLLRKIRMNSPEQSSLTRSVSMRRWVMTERSFEVLRDNGGRSIGRDSSRLREIGAC